VLEELDRHRFAMIEQPLSHDDLVDNAELARVLETPICLDESVKSPDDARKALAIGACRLINIKPGRVGGLHQARRIHDLCQEHGLPVWCGGLLETGIGRAHNVALSTLPNFRLPGDVSASRRYYQRDIVKPPFELNPDGTITVPAGTGIGVTVDQRRLEECTVRSQVFQD
jgi:O-succinylbenzoate synthase